MNEQIKAIRAEIERRIKEYDAIIESQPDSNRAERDAWKWAEDKSLLSFIDSLPEETDNEAPNRPKLSDNLEEAAEQFAHRYDNGTCDGIAQDCFIAGAEWQKEQMMEEWLQDRGGCFFDGVEEGKKAMKEQMMKETVEGEVYQYYSYNRDAIAILVDIPKENIGYKVRIIIIKEEG